MSAPNSRNPKGVEPGDWVRFYRSGQMVIGQVHYVRDDGWRAEASTDAGITNCDSILEVRENTKAWIRKLEDYIMLRPLCVAACDHPNCEMIRAILARREEGEQ